MFRITAHYDDRHHPLDGDVVTVASVAEALAAMPEAEPEDGDGAEWVLNEILDYGGSERFFGFQVEYTVERV